MDKKRLEEQLIEEGMKLFEESNFEEAIIKYDKALEIEKSSEALNNKGNALRHLKKYNDAMNCFDQSLELNKDIWQAWHGKANIFFDTEEYEQCLECYNKILDLYPEDSQKAIILSEKGCLLCSLGRGMEAEECLKLALILNPTNIIVLQNQILSYAYQGKKEEFQNCISNAMKFIPDNKRDIFSKNLNSVWDIIQENRKELVNEKEEGQEQSAEFWNYQSDIMFEMGDYTEALVYVNKALDLNPNFYSALVNKAKSLKKIGEKNNALDLYKKALELKPDNSSNWYNAGVILAELGNYKDALEFFNHAILLEKSEIDYRTAKGLSLFGLKKFKEALECFNIVLSNDPNNNIAIDFKHKIIQLLEKKDLL